MDMDSVKTPVEANVKLKKRKRRRRGKMKANDGCVIQSMDQKDKNVNGLENGKDGMVAKVCSQNKLLEMDSATKLSQENPQTNMESTANPLEKSTKSKKWRRKVKANNGHVIHSMDQKDKNMNDLENGKNGMIAKASSQNNLLEVDCTTKLSQENPQTNMVSTTNPLEKSTKSKKRRGKMNSNNGHVIQSTDLQDKNVNDVENGENGMIVKAYSQNNLLKVDSAAKLAQANPQTNMDSATNPSEKSTKSKKRRRKRKANDGNAVQSMDQQDKNVSDLENGKVGMIAKACSQNNLLEVDSATKLSQANPQTNMDSSTNPSEKSTESKKRMGKIKANDRHVIQSMDQKDKNVNDLENGKNGMIAKACSQINLLEEDSTKKSSQENPQTNTDSTTTPSEKSTKSKKRKRRMKMKANDGHVVQSMDQKDKNVNDLENGKDGMIAKACLQNNLLEDSAAKMSRENPQPNTDSTTNLLEKSTKSKRRRQRRAKKKAESKLGPQSMDHANIISDMSLADASGACPGCKTNNITNESQESRLSTGKDSAISLSSNLANLAQKDVKLVNNRTASSPSLFRVSSFSSGHQFSHERVQSGFKICNNEVMECRSSEVINEAQNSILAHPCQIPQRRKLLILDVNGLLADIVMPPPKKCKADKILGRAIFKRPFYYDFLKFCFESFDVGIWSSRSRRVIDKVVDYLLGDLKQKLLFCWDVFYCTETKFRTLENRHKPLVFKELRKLWEKHDPNLPWEKGDYDESNSLLLDDSPYKALLNPVHTGVFPCSYNHKTERDTSLGPGGDIRVYLEGLATAENVQHYVAQHPFGQSAIDETDPRWNFYSGVLRSFFIQSGKAV